MPTGPRSRPSPGAVRPINRLLRALPDDDYRRLAPNLKTTAVRRKEHLFRDGDRIRRVYFPNGGVWSITSMLKTGAIVEVVTIGDEGMLGLEAILGNAPLALGTTLLQVEDPGESETTVTGLDVEAFRRELLHHGALYELTGRYAHVVVAHVMQSTACNALHDVQQRCARWLLTTHDRVHGRDFHLSHEFLAMMLGVRRQTVTEVAGELQSAGLVRYVHGHVRVLDRPGLESAACECYSSLRTRIDRLGA